MDSILKEEAKKEEEEMIVEASMEETMVKLMEEEGLGSHRSTKKNKEELKGDGEATGMLIQLQTDYFDFLMLFGGI